MLVARWPAVNPTPVGSLDPARPVIIVVPRSDTKLFEYLKRSFAGTPTVQVVLDRRAPAANAARAPIDNDLRRRRTSARSALAGVLIDDAAPAPAELVAPRTPAPATPSAAPAASPQQGTEPATDMPAKTRLWPTLRPNDFTLVTPESREGADEVKENS